VISNGVSLRYPNVGPFNTTLIALPGGTTLDIEITTLPLNFLCQQQGPIAALTCHVCTYDCIYAHNKYGGKCGNASNPTSGTPQEDGQVCVCNDSPPANNGANFTDTKLFCDPLIDPVTGETINLLS
jgi:hypothetical protein